MHFYRLTFVAAAVAGVMAAAPATAESPQKLGTFKSWSAYMSGSGDTKVCYALSTPTMKEPARLKRDPAYFLINDWPGRKAKAEPEIVPGYQYKDGSEVTAEIGSDKFKFFTKNDGGTGGAWMEQESDEKRLTEAMRRGAEVNVTGISKHGTMTRDTYSLAGLSDALDKSHEACGL